MVSDRVKLVGSALLLGVVVLAWAGVGTTSTSAHPDPDVLVAEAAESVETESIAGVRVETVNRGGAREQVTVAVQRAPPHRSRLEVLGESSGPDVTIVNRSTVWQYLEDEGRAVQYENGRSLFSSGFQGHTTDSMLEQYASDYEGTEQYRGRTVHVVELVPPDDEAASLSIDVNAGGQDYEIPLTEATSSETWYVSRETWWIDANTSYPVKKQIEWTDEDGSVVATTTRRYEELTVDPEIDDDAFSLEDPAEREIEEIHVAESEIYESRGAATSAVPFDLPEPDVPASYSLEYITARTYDDEELVLWDTGNDSTQAASGDEHTVVLSYTDGEKSLTVAASEHDPLGMEETVVEQEIDAFDGQVVVSENRAAVVRECPDLTYQVGGLPNIDTLIEVGASVDCQG